MLTPSTSHLPRLAVLLSGRGSNFLAIAAAIERAELQAEVVLTISDKRGAAGLERSRELGIPALAIPRVSGATRAEHEAEIAAALEQAEADWICLAGYMRVLSPAFVNRYPRRILNIHPSLLPSFAGLDVQGQALRHGVKVSGCTVHFVEEGLDTGPIVEQRAVPVLEGDDEEALAARILEQEHLAYPSALRRLLTENWTIDGRSVRFG